MRCLDGKVCDSDVLVNDLIVESVRGMQSNWSGYVRNVCLECVTPA